MTSTIDYFGCTAATLVSSTWFKRSLVHFMKTLVQLMEKYWEHKRVLKTASVKFSLLKTVAHSHVCRGDTTTDTIVTWAMHAIVVLSVHCDKIETGVLKTWMPLSQITSVEQGPTESGHMHSWSLCTPECLARAWANVLLSEDTVKIKSYSTWRAKCDQSKGQVKLNELL